MGNNANVRVWLKGQVLCAVLGSTLPTDTTTVLNAAFKDLGLLTDDGITDDPGRSVKNILALGGLNVRSFVETEEPTVTMNWRGTSVFRVAAAAAPMTRNPAAWVKSPRMVGSSTARPVSELSVP